VVSLSRRLTVKIDPHNKRNISFRAVFRVSLGWRTGVPELTFAGRVSCTGFSPLFEGSDTVSLAVLESQAHFMTGWRGGVLDLANNSKKGTRSPHRFGSRLLLRSP